MKYEELKKKFKENIEAVPKLYSTAKKAKESNKIYEQVEYMRKGKEAYRTYKELGGQIPQSMTKMRKDFATNKYAVSGKPKK